MKPALVALNLFTVGLVMGTVITVMRAPPPELEALSPDSAATDSTHGTPDDTTALAHEPDTEHGAEAGADSSDVPTTVEPTPPEPAPATSDAVPTGPDATPTGPRPDLPTIPAGATPEEREEAYRSLSRIVGQMKPDEAADVLVHMKDDEIEGILRAMGSRKAAALLTNFPRERAATLARRLLVPSRSN